MSTSDFIRLVDDPDGHRHVQIIGEGKVFEVEPNEKDLQRKPGLYSPDMKFIKEEDV